MTSVEQSDETFMRWMRGNLDHAARNFELTISGEQVFGWALRSIGTTARTREGEARWLRVVSERTRWVREMPEFWTGNADANTITGVAKPRILDILEWEVPDQERSVRGEVMTFLPGVPCSSTDALRLPVELSDSWWEDMCLTLAHLRTVDTERFTNIADRSTDRVREVFGAHVAETLRPQHWETVHGDLHWNNVLGPDFAIVDWEFWGRGPAGTDAATLYLFSLPVPAIANHVREIFQHVLDSRDGEIAQLLVASRILHRANKDELDDLSQSVREVATDISDKYR